MMKEPNTLVSKDDWRAIRVNLLIVMMFVLLIASPIITGNSYYVDDYYRLLNGRVDYWFSNGRPLAVFLTWILDFSTITTNSAPLPLLIGLISCSTLLILSFRKLPNMPDSMSILLSLSVIISPFLAQGMLYAFDSMAILTSAGLAIYTISVMNRLDIRSGLFGFLLIICTLSLYQPSVNYSSMLILIVFAVNCKEVNALKLLVMHVGVLLSGLVFYKFLIIPLSGMDSYNLHRAESIPFSIAGLYHLYDNIISAFKSVNLAFPGLIKIPVFILLLSGTISCVIISRQLIKESKYIHSLIMLISPCVILIFIPGFLLLLDNANFDPRVLGACSTAIIFFFCASYYTFSWLRKIFVSCIVLYIIFSSVFMCTLFRAAVNQSRFDEDVLVSIRNALSLYPEGSVTGVSFIGALPYSPDILPALRRYPYLIKYFTPALTENNEFRYYGPAKRIMLYAHLYPTTQAIREFVPSEKRVSGCIYDLYKYESIAVVNFKMPACDIPQKYGSLTQKIK